MAFSRKQMVAAVAGTLSLAVLTGCPAATAPTPPVTSPSVAPTTAPGASVAPTTAPGASVEPTTAPGASTDPGASPTTQASAPTPSGLKVIVSGNIYKEDGATVDGALVTVKSLDASVPYEATATSNAGSWVVNDVPEGANVEIVATKDGWTSRRRVGSFQQQATGRRNVINFGAAGGSAATNDDDPTGEAYFISDYPEIVSTTPAHEDTNVDGTKVSFKVTFSEALSQDSRETFDDVFHILPANKEASGATTSRDYEQGEDSGTNDGILTGAADTLTAFKALDAKLYSLAEGDTFLGSTTNRVKSSWNAEGTEVTYSLDAGLLTDDNTAAKYQAVLIMKDNTDKLEDMNSKRLGTKADGSHAASGNDEFIYNAFKETDLAADHEQKNLAGGGAGVAVSKDLANWASTHSTVVSFEVATDDVDPVVTGLDISDDDTDLRVAITFSEPMAAYGGNGKAINDPTVVDPANYTFMLGEKTGDIKDDELDGTVTPVTYDPDNNLKIEAATQANGYGKEFRVNNVVLTTGRPDSGLLAADDVAIEVDENDPKTVLFWFRNGENAFSNVKELAVRVDNVADPATNAIRSKDADTQVKVAKI